MRTPEVVEVDGVRLRPYRADDVDALVAGANDPSTQRFVPVLPDPYTRADAEWWITTGTARAWATGGAAYAIADPRTDRLSGGIGLNLASPVRRQAEIGYWVAPWARRRGVATAATAALTRAAFDAGFDRLELLTEAENGGSQRVALAAGYRYEGLRRAAGASRDGGRHDLLCWVRLGTDPAGPVPRLLPDLPGGALTDPVVTLRRIGPADAEFLHGLHTLPEVVANIFPPVPPERADLDWRCARAESRWLTGERADLVMLDSASGRPVGGCALFYSNPPNGEGMVGYSVLPAWRGRGIATRAVRLLAGWAFGEAGLARLAAGTWPANVASQRVLTRVGFRRDGLLRGGLAGPGGVRVDGLLFGLLPGDLTMPATNPASPDGLTTPTTNPAGPDGT